MLSEDQDDDRKEQASAGCDSHIGKHLALYKNGVSCSCLIYPMVLSSGIVFEPAERGE